MLRKRKTILCTASVLVGVLLSTWTGLASAAPVKTNATVKKGVKVSAQQKKNVIKKKTTIASTKELQSQNKDTEKMAVDTVKLPVSQIKVNNYNANLSNEPNIFNPSEIKGTGSQNITADATTVQQPQINMQDTTTTSEPPVKDSKTSVGPSVNGTITTTAPSVDDITTASQSEDQNIVDTSKVNTNSPEYQALLNLVTDVRTGNKEALLNITSSKILEGCLPGVSKMKYEDAKQTIIKAMKYFTNTDITIGSLTDVEIQVLSALRTEKIQEAKQYGVDITGLSDADAIAKIEAAKQEMIAKDAEDLKKLAAEYNVNITGLSNEEAWKKVKKVQTKIDNETTQAEAKKAGVDIKGLSMDDAWKKIKAAEESQMMATLRSEAASLGVDISGLSPQDAKELVNKTRDAKETAELNTEAARYNVDITGLSMDDASIKIRQARAALYGVDISGLSMNDAEMKIKQAEKAAVEAKQKADQLESANQEAQKIGVDISGLSYEDAIAKIQEAKNALVRAQNDTQVNVQNNTQTGSK